MFVLRESKRLIICRGYARACVRVYADRRITRSFARGVIVHAVTKRNGEEGKGRDRERERKKGKRNGDRNDLIRHGWIVSKLRGFDVHVRSIESGKYLS